MARTATVNVYDSPGTGDLIWTGVITFPEQVGYEHRVWNYIGGSFGIHTFKLPFANEAYGIRTTSGIINGPIAVQGFRFDRIEIDFDTATPSLSADDEHDWLFVTGNTIVMGGDFDGLRHSHGPRNAFRVRCVLDADADTVFLGAAQISKSIYMGPGYEVPLPESMIVPAGAATVTSMGMYNIITDRTGLTHPLGYMDSGFGVGGGSMLHHAAGFEQNYRVAKRRANRVMDRHGVDCVDYYTGEPAQASLITHNPGPTLGSGYGLDNGANGEGWRVTDSGGMNTQPPEFYDTFDVGYPNKSYPRWHNATAGTHEEFQYRDSVQYGTHHLRQTTAQVEPLARHWGDPIAEFDLAVIAQDVEYRILRYVPTIERESYSAQGQGSVLLGARHYGWSIDTLAISPIARHRAIASKLAECVARVQMPNGCVYHHGVDHNYSPDPWASGSTGGTFADDVRVQQTMEMAITAFACARAGFPEVARKYVEAMYIGGAGSGGSATDYPVYTLVGFGYRPKWIGVKTDSGAKMEHRARLLDGVGDYWSWMELGLGIVFSDYKTAFIAAASTMILPAGGVAGSLAAARAYIIANPSYNEQAAFFVAAQEAYVPL